MSNKRSDFGSLAARSSPTEPTDERRSELPRHVWVDGSNAGLLVAWQRTPDRAWWGLTVTVDADGRAEENWIIASRLTPA